MSTWDINDRLVAAYRRERLSFLQYVRQATPYAGPGDRPVLERIQQLADAEAAELDDLAGYLDDHRISVRYLGAFPMVFTNYNFVAVRKLLPDLITDADRGLAALEHDLAALPPGDVRARLEKIAEIKRMHRAELQKLTEPA